MKIRVNPHNVEILKEQTEPINEREIKVSKCEFEFDEAITNEFVKEAYFTLNGNTYKMIVENNECDYPSEVLTEKGTLEIGVVAFKVENGEEIIRYNPSPDYFESWVGSLKDAENSEPITPSEMEQFEQELQDGLEEVNSKLDEIDTALEDVNIAIEETNNLDLDVSKEGKVATVTLTKKDDTTKTVTLSDGTSLMFNWDGTKLGIKTDEDSDYTYVDLQGVQGIPGPKGDAFQIKKTYSSVAEMNADFNNMQLGDYVMIASTVEVEDNAKLYTRGESQWIFISDFSGAQGIKGETGATPNIQIGTVTSGSTPSVTRTGTNENPVLNFVLQPGEKGNKGDTGATGNGIASITKTGTSGLVDTYTITFTDGNTTTFNITNGNGIDRIELTSQSGATKVYTIYFTDGNTTTFTVQDGEVTQEVFDEEVDRLKMVYNAMPKVSDEGTDLTLDNTAECPVYDIELKGNTSQSGTPTPESPQDIHVVSGDNTIKVEGKNLFDGVFRQGNQHNNWNTSRIFSNKNDWKVNVGDKFTFSTNLDFTTFDYSFYIMKYPYLSVSSNTILYISNYQTTNTFTINCEYEGYLGFTIRKRNESNLTPSDVSNYWFQIEKGSSASEFQPYQSASYPISLGDIELCKIGDYQDYIYKENGNWYKHEVIKKGNTSSFGIAQRVTSTMGDNLYGYAINVPSIKIDYSDLGSVISNIFVPKILGSTESTTDPNNVRFNQGISKHSNHSILQIVISINKSYLTTGNVDEVIPFLNSKDFIFYFLLQTPTEVQITDTTLINQLNNLEKANSYDEQTNISQVNNDLPFIITAEAILSLKNILNI